MHHNHAHSKFTDAIGYKLKVFHFSRILTRIKHSGFKTVLCITRWTHKRWTCL